MVNKIEMLDDSQFKELIEHSTSVADVLRKLDYSVKGNSWAYQIINNRMQELSLRFKDNKSASYSLPTAKIPLSEILVEHCSYNTSRLRSRLIKEGLKEEKCECCGITEWQGKPLNFELHHINGVHTDNRIENLQILCPNCHSQTENFGSKNSKKKKTTNAQSRYSRFSKERNNE